MSFLFYLDRNHLLKWFQEQYFSVRENFIRGASTMAARHCPEIKRNKALPSKSKTSFLNLTPFTRPFIMLFLVVVTLALVTPALAAGSSKAAGKITLFAIPTANSSPTDITSGSDGNFWFVESQNPGKIGKITPRGAITEFLLPPQSFPKSITAGPDGNLWFTAPGISEIGKITPNGQITLFASPQADDITAGPDGNLWFTMIGGAGRITLAGQITLFPGPLNREPVGITTGPDGNLWFLDPYDPSSQLLCKIDPSTGQITAFPQPANSGPTNITRGPKGDSHLWFTNSNSASISRFDPSTGRLTTFLVPAGQGGLPATPTDITVGSDGNLWFTNTDAVDRMNLSGKVTQFPLSHALSTPLGITAGPGAVWFVEYFDNKIGKITT
jgi:streptogramin lyase